MLKLAEKKNTFADYYQLGKNIMNFDTLIIGVR